MPNPIKQISLWLIASLALAGCGADPGNTVVTPNNYAPSSYDSSLYSAYPTPDTGSTGTPYGYTSDYATDIPSPLTVDTALPTGAATSSATIKRGVEVELLDSALPGIWKWERCEAQIRITNHEDTASQGFLFVSYTLKGREVELQYRALSLAPGASKTFTMTSSVQADAVTLEYRTKLL